MSDRSGQSLGAYRLVRLLGQGGFAEVYLGQHIHLNTRAAIKILLATKLDDEAEIESFRREAQTIATLTHANIVRVLDFNIEQGVPFFVMEYAAQGSLRKLHPRGTRLPLPIVISYIRQVAAALQYAHEHKQIHRDVKPENILVRDDGSLMLSDFGIATIAHSSVSQRTEDMIGTVLYMAPEQTVGHPHPASDQYALAITAYEWLAGRHPFRGTTIEIAMQHATATPPSLVAQIPGLPVTVQQVLFKALTKDPKERFATMQEFAQALERAEQSTADPAGYTPTQWAGSEPAPTARVRQAEPPPPVQNMNAAPLLTPETPIRSAFPSTGGNAANYQRTSEPLASPYGQPGSYPANAYAPPPPPLYEPASGYPAGAYTPSSAYGQPGGYAVPPSGYAPPASNPYGAGYQQPSSQVYNAPRPSLYNTAHPHGPTSLKMSPNTSAGLSYLVSWITGLIFLLSEKQSRFVRFHALQSLFYTSAYIVYLVLFFIAEAAVTPSSVTSTTVYSPAYSVVNCLAGLFGLAWFVLWLVCMICAFQGKYFKFPLIGHWALRIANRPKRG